PRQYCRSPPPRSPQSSLWARPAAIPRSLFRSAGRSALLYPSPAAALLRVAAAGAFPNTPRRNVPAELFLRVETIGGSQEPSVSPFSLIWSWGVHTNTFAHPACNFTLRVSWKSHYSARCAIEGASYARWPSSRSRKASRFFLRSVSAGRRPALRVRWVGRKRSPGHSRLSHHHARGLANRQTRGEGQRPHRRPRRRHRPFWRSARAHRWRHDRFRAHESHSLDRPGKS